MSLVLDAGALIGFQRGDHTVLAVLERAARTGTDIRTTTGAVAQVWRNGSRQATLALLLRGVDEAEFGREEARRVGALLGQSGTVDVVDASIVDIAVDGDEILTSDPKDIATVAAASGKTVIITRV